MRVFSAINKYQWKKFGALLLGLARSNIFHSYYSLYLSVVTQLLDDIIEDFSPKSLFGPATIFLMVFQN